MTKRFSTNGYYIYDHFKGEERWLVNEVEADEIVDVMNNLDCKARERSKALSKLQKENNEIKQFKEQVFHLIDKKLKENEELNGVDTAMYYANKGTLNELKKELF